MATSAERKKKGKKKQGTVIRGADGELYFIRSEVLDACKVTEDDMKKFLDGLLKKGGGGAKPRAADAEVRGGRANRLTFSTGEILESVALEGPFSDVLTDTGIPDLGQVASTVMCPGTMGLADFEIINPVA